MSGWSFDDDPPDSRAVRVAENAVAQTRRLKELIAEAVADIDRFNITVEMICELQRLAMDGLIPEPGALREADVIVGLHEPPPWQQVRRYVEELCSYLNTGPDRDPIFLAAYALWRLNWIHPFVDGNGRTSRAISYLILCLAFGKDLPGNPNMLEMMLGSREQVRYRDGLAVADRAWIQGRVDVAGLESLIVELLSRQLDAAG